MAVLTDLVRRINLLINWIDDMECCRVFTANSVCSCGMIEVLVYGRRYNFKINNNNNNNNNNNRLIHKSISSKSFSFCNTPFNKHM